MSSETTVDYATNNYRMVRGFKFSWSFSEETIESGLSYQARPDDLFVVSYPKCGATWTQQIVTLMLNNGEIPGGQLNKASPFLDMVGKEPAETVKRPVLLKSHFPQHLQPWHPEAKYIIVIRNPKDALVSFYHHRVNLHKRYFTVTDIHKFAWMWSAGEMSYGRYFDWYKTWLPSLELPNVKLFVYEDMKVDITKAVREMAEFIGMKEQLEANDDQLLKVILEKSSVDKMKEQLRKTATSDFLLVRKGVIGDWKSQLSNEDSELVDKEFKERFGGTKFENIWDDYDV